MIKKEDYLKLFAAMESDERSTYFADVKTWNEETYPRLLAHVEAWSEAEVKDFDTGMLLATAMQQARSFVAKADCFSHDKALDLLHRYMTDIAKYDQGPKDVINKREGLIIKKYRHVAATPSTMENEDGSVTMTSPATRTREIIEQVAGSFDERRPGHYDSWRNKMSEKLGQQVDNLQSLYLELAAARELAEKLDDNPKATTADRAAANKRVLFWDDQIRAVHALADKEWEILQGKIPVEPAPVKKRKSRKKEKM